MIKRPHCHSVFPSAFQAAQRSDLLIAHCQTLVHILARLNGKTANLSKLPHLHFIMYSLSFSLSLPQTETQLKRSRPYGTALWRWCRRSWQIEFRTPLDKQGLLDPRWEQRKLSVSLCHALIEAEIIVPTTKWLLTALLIIKDESKGKGRAPGKKSSQ